MTTPNPTEGYITWDEGDAKAKAIALYRVGEAYKKAEPVLRSSGGNTFLNVAPGNVSVRDGFSRRDYESFRRGDALPVKQKEVMAACGNAYASVGIVRNVIDLMSDFAVQGIDIVHPNERIEKFYKEWFRRVSGPERSERFLNYLYRLGNVVVKRQTARLTARDEDRLKRSMAAPDIEMEEPQPLQRREIPWRYTFLNPMSVEVVGESLAPFIGADAFAYAVRLPDNLVRTIKKPRGNEEKALVARLPEDIRKRVAAGQKTIPLDQEKTWVAHYKRDDWQPWATPMLAPILKDLQMLEKMKLADLTALDGAISSIRVWKLGSLAERILPSETVIMRLAEMLANNVGGGVMDLIWGPDIELHETSTDTHHFLGDTKYGPTLNAIFQGLGIPPTLTGNASPGGFTNNYISLKTLTERLEYGRSLLLAWWEYEIRLVQRAMGFRFPARLVFDRLLTDEAAEKQLLLHLWDRDLVSNEYVQEVFGAVPEIERVRIRREQRKRADGMLPIKASPFHDANLEGAMAKIFAQSGAYTPSEMGVELQEKKAGEKTPAEVQADLAPKKTGPEGAPPGQSGEGRPRLSRDQNKRKQKTVKPRTKASARFLALTAWAEDALATVIKMTSPAYLKTLSKGSLRELTSQEARDYEQFAFGVLCQLEPESRIDRAVISKALASPLAVPAPVGRLLRATVGRYTETTGREPAVALMRRFQAAAYALYRGDDVEEESGHSDDRLPPLPRAGEEPARVA